MDEERESGLHLHLQCPTGISGDMFLAAVADLGLDLAPLAAKLAKAGMDAGLRVEKDTSCGLTGTRVVFDRAWDHDHPLRTLDHIRPIIEAGGFSEPVTTRSLAAFERLAQVEAEAHGVSTAEVHFHEVGAVDTVVDVVGCFWALEQLGVQSVSCSALPWFRGEVECASGLLPLPAPATVRLLHGKLVAPTDFTRELITPTGALIVDQAVSSFGSPPVGVLHRSGTGLGDADLGRIPNGLRAFLLQSSPGLDQEAAERVILLESNLDHLTGEEVGALFAPLFTAGALDVIYLPGVMKKNRPGGILQVLCKPEDLAQVQACFFEQTLTLGLRRREMERVVLPRREGTGKSTLGSLPAKTATWQGEEWSRPEFEALQALAAKTGRSVVQLRYLLQGLNPDGET